MALLLGNPSPSKGMRELLQQIVTKSRSLPEVWESAGGCGRGRRWLQGRGQGWLWTGVSVLGGSRSLSRCLYIPCRTEFVWCPHSHRFDSRGIYGRCKNFTFLGNDRRWRWKWGAAARAALLPLSVLLPWTPGRPILPVTRAAFYPESTSPLSSFSWALQKEP